MSELAAGTAELHFVGNATVLIRYGDLTLLTDPNFLHRGQRASLGHGPTSRRLTEPDLDSRALPSDLSAIVLSHLHGDHWDRMASRLLPPVMGSLLHFGEVGGEARLRMYLTGDPLMFAGIREIAHRFPEIDLAVVHLGGTTLPGGLLVTMDGLQGADLLETIQPRRALPVHDDDYTVFRSPLEHFLREVAQRGLQNTLVHCARGERVRVGARGEVAA